MDSSLFTLPPIARQTPTHIADPLDVLRQQSTFFSVNIGDVQRKLASPLVRQPLPGDSPRLSIHPSTHSSAIPGPSSSTPPPPSLPPLNHPIDPPNTLTNCLTDTHGTDTHGADDRHSNSPLSSRENAIDLSGPSPFFSPVPWFDTSLPLMGASCTSPTLPSHPQSTPLYEIGHVTDSLRKSGHSPEPIPISHDVDGDPWLDLPTVTRPTVTPVYLTWEEFEAVHADPAQIDIFDRTAEDRRKPDDHTADDLNQEKTQSTGYEKATATRGTPSTGGKHTLVTEPRLFSEAGPAVMDALMRDARDPLSLQNTDALVVDTRVYLASLLQALLGRESRLFAWSVDRSSLAPRTAARVRIPGHTVQMVQAVSSVGLSCGTLYRGLKHFITTTYDASSPNPCRIALASSLDEILRKIESHITLQAPPPSLLPLQATMTPIHQLLSALDVLVAAIPTDLSEKSILEAVFETAQVLELTSSSSPSSSSSSHRHPHQLSLIMRAILCRVSRPWWTWVEGWLGLGPEVGLPQTKDQVGRSVFFVQVAMETAVTDVGESENVSEFVLRPEHVPSFLSVAMARQVVEAGRNIRLLRAAHPSHVLSSAEAIRQRGPPRLRWRFDWGEIIELERRAQTYAEELAAAVMQQQEREDGGREAAAAIQPERPFVVSRKDNSRLPESGEGGTVLNIFGQDREGIEQHIAASMAALRLFANAEPHNTLDPLDSGSGDGKVDKTTVDGDSDGLAEALHLYFDGSSDPRIHGSSDPRIHGSSDPRNHPHQHQHQHQPFPNHASPNTVTPVHVHTPHWSLLPALCLGPMLTAHGNMVNRESMRLFFSQHRLRAHLHVLYQFFLFGNGHFALRLAHALFDPNLSSSSSSSSTRTRDAHHVGAAEAGLCLAAGGGGRDAWPPASSELRLALMGLLRETYDRAEPNKHPVKPQRMTGKKRWTQDHHVERKTQDGGPRTTQDDDPRNTHDDDPRNTQDRNTQDGDVPGDVSFAIRVMPADEVDRCLDRDGLEALDFLRLSYQPSAALQSVFSPDIMRQYDRVFRHMLRLVRLVHVVRHLHGRVHERRHRHYQTAAAQRSSRAARTPAETTSIFPDVYVRFVYEAHHWVTCLHAHFLQTGIAVPWQAFSTWLDHVQAEMVGQEEPRNSESKTSAHGLSGAQSSPRQPSTQSGPSPDQLRQVHGQVLDAVTFVLFLHKRQRPVLSALEDVFRVVLALAKETRVRLAARQADVDQGIERELLEYRQELVAAVRPLYTQFRQCVRVFLDHCQPMTDPTGALDRVPSSSSSSSSSASSSPSTSSTGGPSFGTGCCDAGEVLAGVLDGSRQAETVVGQLLLRLDVNRYYQRERS